MDNMQVNYCTWILADAWPYVKLIKNKSILRLDLTYLRISLEIQIIDLMFPYVTGADTLSFLTYKATGQI